MLLNHLLICILGCLVSCRRQAGRDWHSIQLYVVGYAQIIQDHRVVDLLDFSQLFSTQACLALRRAPPQQRLPECPNLPQIDSLLERAVCAHRLCNTHCTDLCACVCRQCVTDRSKHNTKLPNTVPQCNQRCIAPDAVSQHAPSLPYRALWHVHASYKASVHGVLPRHACRPDHDDS